MNPVQRHVATWQDAGALDTEDAIRGAMIFTGASVAIVVIALSKGKNLGAAMVLGSVAAIATGYAVKRATT